MGSAGTWATNGYEQPRVGTLNPGSLTAQLALVPNAHTFFKGICGKFSNKIQFYKKYSCFICKFLPSWLKSYIYPLSPRNEKKSSKLCVYTYSLHYKYLVLPCNITCVRVTYDFLIFKLSAMRLALILLFLILTGTRGYFHSTHFIKKIQEGPWF